MKTKKNDFIELEFTAKVKDGQVFDTTQADEALKSGLITEQDLKKPEISTRFHALKICIGQEQVLKALDKELEDKEIGKEYETEIKAKEAYGSRDAKLVRTVPLSAFEQYPERGMFVNVNGIAAKVVSVMGGRVLIDMNHPLANKDLIYKFKILKILEDNKEKIQSFLEPFNIQQESIEIKENKSIITIKEKVNEKLKQELSKKIKEILGLEIEFLEKEEKKEEKQEEKAEKEEAKKEVK
jgi:FKBP-type peptidyl-prolyl cis-trans isomerase 2